LGETCSHVGALLYKIETANRLGYTHSACTDQPCQWNENFTKNVTPDTIADITFYKPKAAHGIDTPSMLTTSTDAEQTAFLDSLNATHKSAVGLSSFQKFASTFYKVNEPRHKPQKLPSSLRTLYNPDNTTQLQEKCEEVVRTLQITAAEISYVEQATRKQSETKIWHELRVGRITSTTAHLVAHTDRNNFAKSILKQICTVDRKLNVPQTRWGTDNEAHGFWLHTAHCTGFYDPLHCDSYPTGTIYADASNCVVHVNFSCQKSGLIIEQQHPFLAASPAGIMSCDCHSRGVLEVKCPYKYRDGNLTVAFGESDFCLNDNLEIKENHKWYTQVQFEMYIAQAAYCHLVVWTPGDAVIKRIERDEPFIDRLIDMCTQSWKENILPELLTRRLETGSGCSADTEETVGLVANEMPGTSQISNIYCICRSSREDEEMVACDSCDEWFHISCLGLKRVPKSKNWFCKECKKKKAMKK